MLYPIWFERKIVDGHLDSVRNVASLGVVFHVVLPLGVESQTMFKRWDKFEGSGWKNLSRQRDRFGHCVLVPDQFLPSDRIRTVCLF